jgi:hypothetical protein
VVLLPNFSSIAPTCLTEAQRTSTAQRSLTFTCL